MRGTLFFLFLFGCKKKGKVTVSQGAIFSGGEIVKTKLANGDAFEVGHFETLTGEHTADLSLHALMDDDVQRGGSILAATQAGDLCRRSFLANIRKVNPLA